MSPDSELLQALAAVRRHWRRRLLLESAVKILLAVAAAVAMTLVVTAIFGSGDAAVLAVRLVGYVLIAAALLRFAVLPLMRRASDERLALYIEERAPELRQALLAAVHELAQPPDRRASAALTALVVRQAATALRPIARAGTIERPRTRRAVQTLAFMAVGGAALFAFGPLALRDAARLLFAPWRDTAAAAPAFAVNVTPGNASVPRGGAIEVRATLAGFAATGAELVFRPDSEPEWVRLPMSPDSADGAFDSRLFDLIRTTEYYVEADNVRSPVYRVTVTDLPAAQRIALELRFPAYTRQPPERIEDGGDVAAVVGTTVRVRVIVTKPVGGGSLRWDRGPLTALTRESDSTLTGSFRVTRDGFYRVDLSTLDGQDVAGSVQYAVQALADGAPTVTIAEPGRDTRVTSVEEVPIAIRASDDYGVRQLELRYSVNGGEERAVALADSAAGGSSELRAAHTLFLEEHDLEPGDLVSYHAVARDAAGNRALSDVYFLEVRPYSRNYRQAEQGGGGGGGGGQSPEGFVPRQRQIVAATFNWLRDSATTDDRRRGEDLTTVAISQGRLREDVTGILRRLEERGVASSDTTFTRIREELDSAARVMQPAEELLGRGLPREALPVEQRALQHLQRAEALYRDVQVQLSQDGQGGGGGEQQSAEDLADLFELETDKLRNQYESVQRESQQSAERELDEVMERLRQLASRQQQENERMQRMAEAMQERAGRPSGGGGGAQRELARQAEEEARRLERLARERNAPELAEAARRLRETAEAMRRAAGGQTAQGNAALEELRRTARELESARSTELADNVRRLAERARELRERQRGIAEGVGGLPDATPEERAERVRRLSERKDGLAGDVERLEADADRLARTGRRDQPEAAGALGQAAEALRESRVGDKIKFSKGVMQGGSREYAEAFERQIAEDLARAGARMDSAARALTGESAERRRERALENARELVRGLESLRDRIGERQGQGEGQGEGQNDASGASPQSGTNPTARGDSRQFSREFRMRRQAAQELRRELAREGVDVSELDRAIGRLRELESGRPFGDPRGLTTLQAEAIERLKTFEFMLYRRLGLGDGQRPAVGGRAQVPPEYRALVEEYYRSLGRRAP